MGTLDKDEAFKGFHKIEAFIYRDGDLKAAVPYLSLSLSLYLSFFGHC
ncbi:MAG: hypothetical protein AAFW70_23300 [Cyanobacteria bacterium J06635_10]